MNIWRKQCQTAKAQWQLFLGMDPALLRDVTEEVTKQGHPVQIANMNSRAQIVISGTKTGVELASQKKAKEKRRQAGDSSSRERSVSLLSYEAGCRKKIPCGP
ncbi:hypothetical protein GCM10020331_047540 [Ectobacillus funiculus]